MPALGITITERMVRQAFDEMADDPERGVAEFERAWLNVTNAGSSDRVISAQAWQQATGDHRPAGQITLAIDGTPDQSAASVVAADSTGRGELIDHRPGTAWVKDRTVELARRWNASVVVDARGPLGHLIGGLESERVEVVAFDTRDYIHACAAFIEQLPTLRVRTHQAFTVAVAGAKKRPVGDSWVWARKGIDTDISPLVALTLAINGATRDQPTVMIEGDLGI